MGENELKPGHKTSEFWITVALTALATVAMMLPEELLASKIILGILAGASVFGYNVSRGMVKRGNGGE